MRAGRVENGSVACMNDDTSHFLGGLIARVWGGPDGALARLFSLSSATAVARCATMPRSTRLDKTRPPLSMPQCACGDAGASCILSNIGKEPCVHEPTDAAASDWIGTHCLSTATRGFFIVSRAANSRAVVCTGGDTYHVWAVSDKLRFAALSRPIPKHPSVYWVDMNAASILRGESQYDVQIALIETVRREMHLSMPDDVDDLALWLRASMCVWRLVTKASPMMVAIRGGVITAPEPYCGTLPADGQSMGYLTLEQPETCNNGHACDGDAYHHLLNTSNDNRYRVRERRGFRHVLKPIGCRMRLYDETAIAKCLRGRQLLNIGSDISVDLQRGFAGSTAPCARGRAASRDRSRSSAFRDRLPTMADFNYQFERTGGFNGRGPDIMAGKSMFGSGSVGTQYLQHPPHYGLANMLEPDEVRKKGGRVGFRRTEEYRNFMCRHDIVVFESGLADFGMAFNEHNTWATNKVRPRCAGQKEAECEAALAPALQGEEWRRNPMTSYKRRLGQLIEMWRHCKASKPHFRAIFAGAGAARTAKAE